MANDLTNDIFCMIMDINCKSNVTDICNFVMSVKSHIANNVSYMMHFVMQWNNVPVL